MTTAIRTAKLQAPAIASDAIARDRIQQLLDGISACRLTLLAAPSGFGKTTAMRQWQLAHPDDVLWLTIDAADDDPERLLRHIVAALSSRGPVVGRNTLDLLDDTSRPAPAELAGVLADELYEDERMRILVLDECENLQSGVAWDVIEGLLKQAPASLHVVCISRVDPPLPLARYRARGQLLELRGTDLQFSLSETGALIDRRAGRQSPEVVSLLQRQTHGWPAAVTLAAMALKRAGTQTPWSQLGAEAAPFDALNALAQDVFAGVPPLDRQAYTAAALVDPVSPQVLSVMLERPLPECAELLQGMQRAGLARGLVDERGWWLQLHPLFRDLFLHQAAAAEPVSLIRAWHARAALALEQQGDHARAIRHWLLAGEQERALDLLEAIIPVAFQQERWSDVAEKLASISEVLILARPSLAFGWGWTLFVRGQWGALNGFLERVQAQIASGHWNGDDLPFWTASFDVLATFGVYQSNVSPDDMLRVLDGAAAILDVDHSYVRGYSDFQRVWALQSVGRARDALRASDAAMARFGGAVDAAYGRAVFSRVLLLRQQGAIAEAEATALANIDALRSRGMETVCAWLNMLLGWIAYQRNDFDRAIAALSAVVTDYRDVHGLTIRDALGLLAVIHAQRGEWDEARAIMRRVREILGEFGATELMAGVLLTEEWLAQLAGQSPSAIVGHVMPAEEARRTTTGVILHPSIVRIHLHLGAGTPAGALRALDEIAAFREVVSAAHCVFRVPQLDLLDAVAHWRLGNADDARRLLQRALEHPASGFQPREFFNYERDVRALQDRLPVPLLPDLPLAKVEPPQLVTTTALAERRGAEDLVRLLTARELTVLEGLAQRLSYKEIAERLNISPATVKRHAGNLYLKLDAGSRREAVARAIELGFVASQPPG